MQNDEKIYKRILESAKMEELGKVYGNLKIKPSNFTKKVFIEENA